MPQSKLRTFLGLISAIVVLVFSVLPAAAAATEPPVQEAYIKPFNTDTGDAFGRDSAISGDTLVVGAFQEDSKGSGVNSSEKDDNSLGDSGAAYVFVRNGGSWSQQAYLKASNPGLGDYFGLSVAISGDTIVVGAPGESSAATGVNGNQANDDAGDAGAAYVFQRSGSTWVQQAYLKASNTDMGDEFGTRVAISGNTIAVAAPNEKSNATGINGSQTDNSARNAGAVYVFIRSGSSWSQQAYIKASNTGVDDYFGSSIAISGETLVVGAKGESSSAKGVGGNQGDNSALDAGAAYVFVRSGSSWTQQAYLKASNSEAADNFGNAAAISGDTVVIAAYWEDSSATGVNGDQSDNSAPVSGAAYVFVRSNGNWAQQAYLKASNTRYDNSFGYSVAVSGDFILIGAPLEDSDAVGVNGTVGTGNRPSSGAAYFFVRSGSTWTQQVYLKASNPEMEDNFGLTVGADGGTLVCGAVGEDSDAISVNGDQNNNGAPYSGAAYVFTFSHTPEPPSRNPVFLPFVVR